MTIIIHMILGMILYSFISTILYLITKQNDEIALICGIGICGWILMAGCWVIKKILRYKQYHNKRSIIVNKETGEHRWCHLKYTNDICLWNDVYRLIKRYADKDEWKVLSPCEKEYIQKCQINCDHCKYDGSICCSITSNMRCKHNKYGEILEFNQFEKK